MKTLRQRTNVLRLWHSIGISILTALLFPPTPHMPAHVAPMHAESRSERTWDLPMQAPVTVVNAFRPPEHAYAAGHRGVDFKTHLGADITAPVSGTVHFVGVVAQKPVITIRVDDETLYTFEPVESNLATGDLVVTGQPLGITSSGGHCESQCVHLGVRVNGAYVNPLRFLLSRPSLLPVFE